MVIEVVFLTLRVLTTRVELYGFLWHRNVVLLVYGAGGTFLLVFDAKKNLEKRKKKLREKKFFFLGLTTKQSPKTCYAR